MPPAISEIDPNSPMALAKANPKPPSTAGQSDGKTTQRNVRMPPAPSDFAAASDSPSSDARTGWTARSENGRSMKASKNHFPGNLSRTNTQAMATPMTALIAATESESHKDSRIALI